MMHDPEQFCCILEGGQFSILDADADPRMTWLALMDESIYTTLRIFHAGDDFDLIHPWVHMSDQGPKAKKHVPPSPAADICHPPSIQQSSKYKHSLHPVIPKLLPFVHLLLRVFVFSVSKSFLLFQVHSRSRVEA